MIGLGDVVLRWALVLAAAGTFYHWALLIGSLRPPPVLASGGRRHRFAILIPAHDEAGVLARTLNRLRELDYPRERFRVYVVADHCGDDTAAVARRNGAQVHERDEMPRGSKGAALAWLITRVGRDQPPDAYVVFDADTSVDPAFLTEMDRHLAAGAAVIQGQHAISNPDDGNYPALADAMLRIDNRAGNLGRSNLGLSAKHMGDSICFRADIVERFWREYGLTEDYALRQRLLLSGIRITYAPTARGWGEAPGTWEAAQGQRVRWLAGTLRSSRQSAPSMLVGAFHTRDAALLDGALQALLPSYSTTVLITLAGLGFELLTPPLHWRAIWPWVVLLALQAAFPLTTLVLDRAPAMAFRGLMSGPFFILWRSALAATARLPGRNVRWQRTPRRQ